LNNYLGLKLAKRFGVPFVLEYNGSEIWMSRHWGKPLKYETLTERIELLNLRAADVVVVVSQAMSRELCTRGIDSDKILVNPNGVDPDRYSPDIDGTRIRAQYHLNGKTVLGFIGTFGKWHGAEVLAEAFGRLLRQFPSYRERVRLLMVGDGIMMPQVKEHLQRSGASEAATLAGLVPQELGPAYLAASDILVSSHVPNPDGTPFFGSPTKLFEYMAMGKGIVASDLDQIGEVLKHDRTAWMAKPGDAQSLMFGLKALIDDQPRRERLGRAARQEVVSRYTWKEHTRKIIEKLKEHCR
jgi:glycosyltransferase involved in cell wall biosynthesis